MQTRPNKQLDGKPWKPAEYTLADVSAIQALMRGDASKEQQIRALRWIVEPLCETYGMSYRPDSDRDTSFAEGKRFVGNQIVKLTKIDLAALRKNEQSKGKQK